MLQTEGVIFLSDQRPVFQTTDFRSYQTTPFLVEEAGNQGVTDLLKVCDNTLAAGKIQSIQTDIPCAVLLLPLVGGIALTTAQGNRFLDAGEFCYLVLLPNDELSIQNPYETALVNYLEVWFNVPGSQAFTNHEEGIFDLDSTKNTLIPLFDTNKTHPHQAWIGKYDGRHDNTLMLNELPTNCFVFIINGVFEAQNRLLEPRDSLLLTDLTEVEFEALADDSIVLIIADHK